VALVSEANTALGVTVVDESWSRCAVTDRVEAVTASDSFVGDIGIIATGASALPSGATSSVSHRTTGPRNNAPRSRPRSKRAAHDPIIVKGGTFYMVSRRRYNVLGASLKNAVNRAPASAKCSASCAMLST